MVHLCRAISTCELLTYLVSVLWVEPPHKAEHTQQTSINKLISYTWWWHIVLLTLWRLAQKRQLNNGEQLISSHGQTCQKPWHHACNWYSDISYTLAVVECGWLACRLLPYVSRCFMRQYSSVGVKRWFGSLFYVVSACSLDCSGTLPPILTT